MFVLVLSYIWSVDYSLIRIFWVKSLFFFLKLSFQLSISKLVDSRLQLKKKFLYSTLYIFPLAQYLVTPPKVLLSCTSCRRDRCVHINSNGQRQSPASKHAIAPAFAHVFGPGLWLHCLWGQFLVQQVWKADFRILEREGH